MQNTFEQLNEVVDKLQLIIKDATGLAQIEKDIILEKMRQTYAALACNSAAPQAPSLPETKPSIPAAIQVSELQVNPGVEEDIDLFFEIGNDSKEMMETEELEDEINNPIEPSLPLEQKEDDPVIEEDDILDFITPKAVSKPVEPQSKPIEQPNPVQPEPKPVEQPTVIEQPKPIQPEPKPVEQPTVATAAPQRSINDLFSEKSKDNSLGAQFQHAKVMDLTKSISVNDKFAFIKELFNNKGEEYSKAIQQLNQCGNIEEAFDCLEFYKKEFFWDSTSNAYLTLCDLIRRKFQ